MRLGCHWESFGAVHLGPRLSRLHGRGGKLDAVGRILGRIGTAREIWSADRSVGDTTVEDGPVRVPSHN